MDGFSNNTIYFILGLLASMALVWQGAWLVTRHFKQLVIQLSGRLTSVSAWERTHPLRSRFKKRYPRFTAHLSRRLDLHEFSGLPLTLLAIAAAYVAFLIGGMIEEVLEAEEIIRLDQLTNTLLTPFRTHTLVIIFTWITDLGGSPALTSIAFVTTGFFWAYRRPTLIVPLWISILGSESTTWLGKWGFDRTRPEFVTSVTAISPSFPSAHATGAMAVYGFIAYALVRGLPGLREKFEISFWTLMLILLIGFSRIFLSVHYLSDVLTGFLVGVFWLLVSFTIAESRLQSGTGT